MSTPNLTPKQHPLPHRLLSKIPISISLLTTSTAGSFLLGITGLWHQWMPTYLIACLIGPSLLPSSQDTLTRRCRRALAAITGAPLGLLLAGDALTQTVAQNYAPIFGPLLTVAAFFSWNAAINAIFIVGALSLIINLLIISHRRTNGVPDTEDQLEPTPTF